MSSLAAAVQASLLKATEEMEAEARRLRAMREREEAQLAEVRPSILHRREYNDCDVD